MRRIGGSAQLWTTSAGAPHDRLLCFFLAMAFNLDEDQELVRVRDDMQFLGFLGNYFLGQSRPCLCCTRTWTY